MIFYDEQFYIDDYLKQSVFRIFRNLKLKCYETLRLDAEEGELDSIEFLLFNLLYHFLLIFLYSVTILCQYACNVLIFHIRQSYDYFYK